MSNECCGTGTIRMTCENGVYVLRGGGGSANAQDVVCDPFSAIFEGGVKLGDCTIGTIMIDTNSDNHCINSSSSSSSSSSNSEGSISTVCCNNPVSKTLHVTFSSGTGSCTCLNGYTTTVTYDHASGKWLGVINACSKSVNISIRCGLMPREFLGQSWIMLIESTEKQMFSGHCDPFIVIFHLSFAPADTICSGSTIATVTE